MKRSLLFWVLCLSAVVCMAQPPRGNRHPRNGGYGRFDRVECATSDQMYKVMRVLKDQAFDDKRYEVATLCVCLGRFCTRDLAEMASVFSFDDERLKFLKYAYASCVDPENYPMLRDSFTFKSNYDELLDFIYPNLKRDR